MRDIMENENGEDIEYLVKIIRISIQLVLNKMNIAFIDKDTENRLIDLCLQDIRCKKAHYDCKFIENLVESQLLKDMS